MHTGSVKALPGVPYPLDCAYDGTGTNFSVFSEVAERIELCLFEEDGKETRIGLTERDGYNWHVYVTGVGPGQLMAIGSRPPSRERNCCCRTSRCSIRSKAVSVDQWATLIPYRADADAAACSSSDDGV
jgi:glycogen operon protein